MAQYTILLPTPGDINSLISATSLTVSMATPITGSYRIMAFNPITGSTQQRSNLVDYFGGSAPYLLNFTVDFVQQPEQVIFLQRGNVNQFFNIEELVVNVDSYTVPMPAPTGTIELISVTAEENTPGVYDNVTVTYNSTYSTSVTGYLNRPEIGPSDNIFLGTLYSTIELPPGRNTVILGTTGSGINGWGLALVVNDVPTNAVTANITSAPAPTEPFVAPTLSVAPAAGATKLTFSHIPKTVNDIAVEKVRITFETNDGSVIPPEEILSIQTAPQPLDKFLTQALKGGETIRVELNSASGELLYGGFIIISGAEVITYVVKMPVGASVNNNAPVTVNLDVEISANGEIKLFGSEILPVSNVVIADVQLPITGLYDATGASGIVDANGNNVKNSMIEFWEDASRGGRAAALAVTDGRNYQKLTRRLVRDLQAVLEGGFDVTGAYPFSDLKYADVPEYHRVADFGNLALRSYAHYLIGHIDATAIITNDVAFENAMLSKGANHPDNAYAGSALYQADPMTGKVGDKTDANLARLLVQAIVTKSAAGDKSLLTIVEQVLGQDASRAMDEDNNNTNAGDRQALKFIAGDIIYMNIKLVRPDVKVDAGNAVLNGTIENKYNPDSTNKKDSYTLKITLKEHTELL